MRISARRLFICLTIVAMGAADSVISAVAGVKRLPESSSLPTTQIEISAMPDFGEPGLAAIYRRKVVAYSSQYPSGTVIVDTARHFLYFIQNGGVATRYGIGVAAPELAWAGELRVGRKAEWPVWKPTRTMVERRPEYSQYLKGVPGGPDNPLGSRAMYLFRGRQDSLYRIHGTNQPWTIGTATSSGCIRMMNEDVEDLYEKVPIGTMVFVR